MTSQILDGEPMFRTDAEACEEGVCMHGRCSEHGCFPGEWCEDCAGTDEDQ